MARSGVDTPKPLVRIAGVSLLEWNLRLLLRAGVDRVLVSVAAGDVEVREAVATQLRPIGEHAGIAVHELVEETALGNIGAVRLMARSVDPVLVVYADNLTAIDLRQIYDDHLTGEADLTLAAHHEPFVMPFGELTVDPDHPCLLVSYAEKPTYRPLVSSAVMVLGPRAVERASADVSMGISQLAQSLVDDGRVVRLWLHDAPWVDVNDRAAIDRAERLVAAHPAVFTVPDRSDELHRIASRRVVGS
jgi:NDP-sugar pyrophosphorylase family protein